MGRDKHTKDTNGNLKKQYNIFKSDHSRYSPNRHLKYNVLKYQAIDGIIDSFSLPHILGYSTIAVQEMNMAYHYPTIYWNCANLIVDSAADEELDGTTDYGKIGVAISNIQQSGVAVANPTINEAGLGFVPDEENNRIIFGFKGINTIGTDLSKEIVANRPYKSIDDFAERMIESKIIQKSKMIQMIKGGCFTELHNRDRSVTMDWFLMTYVFTPCNALTLSQLEKCRELGIIPEQYQLANKMINFKKYVLDPEGFVEGWIDPKRKVIPKRGYHDGRYILDANSQPFFEEHFTEGSVVEVRDGYYVVSEKLFTKEADVIIQSLKDWMVTNEALYEYNSALYNQIYEQYASGTEASWNMEALCYYDDEHELERLDESKYGIGNYFELPEEPVPYTYYNRKIDGEWKSCPKFNISRIAGTVLHADNGRHTVALLTKYGVVNVKMNKGHYAFYSKRISKVNPESGKKQVIEESWLKRGTLLAIAGIRRGDQFWPMIYKDTIYKHTINRILNVNNDGTWELQVERAQV